MCLKLLDVENGSIYVRIVGSQISLLSPLGLNLVKVPSLQIQ